MRRYGTRRHRLSQNMGTLLIRPAAPRLAARHNLHHRSPTTRRSALSSALSHSIIHHIRLRLTSPAQIATLTGPGARWGPDSGYARIALWRDQSGAGGKLGSLGGGVSWQRHNRECPDPRRSHRYAFHRRGVRLGKGCNAEAERHGPTLGLACLRRSRGFHWSAHHCSTLGLQPNGC
jgi:hypothetical protein